MDRGFERFDSLGGYIALPASRPCHGPRRVGREKIEEGKVSLTPTRASKDWISGYVVRRRFGQTRIRGCE